MVNTLLTVKVTWNDALDFSGLPNLPESQRPAVEAAARVASPSNPQGVLDSIALSQWFDFLPVSDNLLTASANPANNGEAVNSIRSTTSNIIFLLETGTGSIKSSTGINTSDTSYLAAFDRSSQMSLVTAISINTADPGQYIFDIGNTLGGADRRVFEASSFVSGTVPAYYDGTGHQEFSNYTINNLPNIFTFQVNGSLCNLRVNGVFQQSISVQPVTSASNVQTRLFGTSSERFNSEMRGLFYFPQFISSNDTENVEQFALAYYGI